MEQIKLLFYTELWANAGIESVIMSLFRNFDRSRISVDIMSSQNLTSFYDEEIRLLGGRKIITLKEEYTSPAKRMSANREAFKRALLENQYDIVHIHMCNAASMIYGAIAKKCGVKTVIYHSHNTNLSTKHRILKTAVHKLCKWRFERYGDALFSCSELASQWMYTKKALNQGKVTLIKNAISLDKFICKPEIREKYRRELCLEGKLVVGHIGRFAVAKNHDYLVDIFSEIHKREPASALLLIGEGEGEQAIREKVNRLGLQDCVIFYGVTNKIPEMLWTMDCFLLPSLFEGNPVVGIEAQAASVSCFFSDTITRMCKLTDLVIYRSLQESPSAWAEAILAAKTVKHVPVTRRLREQGYDIVEVAKEVQTIYENTLSNQKNEKRIDGAMRKMTEKASLG